MLFLIIMWCLSISSIEYKVASFNRFYDGSSMSALSNIEAGKEKPKVKSFKFLWRDYPYFDFKLHHIYFANNVLLNKWVLKNEIIYFQDRQVSLEVKNIYPRKFYTMLLYVHKNSDIMLNSLGLEKTYYRTYLEKLLSLMAIFSSILVLFIPWFLLYILKK